MGLEYGRRRRVALPGKVGTELANAELFFQLHYVIGILPLKIAQQALAAADHVDQTTSGVMILFVGLKVAFQMLNPAAQDRNLHISRTGILLMRTEFRNRLSFDFPIHFFCSGGK